MFQEKVAISKFLSFIKKYSLFAIALFIFFAYTFFVLKPYQYNHFSLIDDGQLYHQNSDRFYNCLNSNNCEQFISQLIEKEFGRFRPIIWFIYLLFYDIFGNNATIQHIARIYVPGTVIIILLISELRRKNVSTIIALASLVFFLTSFSFTENFVRIGPNEPFQLMFLQLYVIWYYWFLNEQNKKKTTIIGALLVLANLLIKETSISIIIASFIHLGIFKRNRIIDYIKVAFLPLLIFITGVIASRNDVSYSSNYELNLISMYYNGLAIAKKILKSFPLSPIYFIAVVLVGYQFLTNKVKLKYSNMIFTVLLLLVFTGILIPWKYVLDRYLLIVVYLYSISFAEVMSYFGKNFKNIKIFSKLAITMTVTWMLMHPLIANYALTRNYVNWYDSIIEIENNFVSAALTLNPETDCVNATSSLSNWEVLYELPIHAKFIHNMDVAPKPCDQLAIIPKKVINYSPLVPYFDVKSDPQYTLQASRYYAVPQHNIQQFTLDVVHKPLTALVTRKEEHEYTCSWSIYEKQ